jgi:hypothetical protein
VDKRADFAIATIGNYQILQVTLVMLRMPESTLNDKGPRVYSILPINVDGFEQFNKF